MLVRVSIQCAKMLVCVLVIVLKGSVLGLVQALIVPFGAYPFFLLNILRRSSPTLSRKKKLHMANRSETETKLGTACQNIHLLDLALWPSVKL